MKLDVLWCHQCDVAMANWADFVSHADRGHAITEGRCVGRCQFP